MEFGPIRAIKGDMILSPALPRLGVRISPDYIYLGDLQYISHDMHHVEEFIFLEPNGLGHATRILLVHFEGFLDNKSGTYNIQDQKMVPLDGEDYQYEVFFLNIQEHIAQQKKSDLTRAADYIRQRSYTLAGDMTAQRFLRLVSADQRDLMSITYLENNDGPILTPALLAQDEAVGRALLEHALTSFEIVHE